MTTVVIPGDAITPSSSSITLGPGISANLSRATQTPRLIAIKPGHLVSESKGKGKSDTLQVEGKGTVVVESSSKRVSYRRIWQSSRDSQRQAWDIFRLSHPNDGIIVSRIHADWQYIASPKDLVLGTIVNRHAEGYRVDIGSAQMASLDALAFEGATKRSKPNLKVSYTFGSRYPLLLLCWLWYNFGTAPPCANTSGRSDSHRDLPA